MMWVSDVWFVWVLGFARVVGLPTLLRFGCCWLLWQCRFPGPAISWCLVVFRICGFCGW